MKKTIIAMLALAGVAFGTSISGTDANTAIKDALTLNEYKKGDIFTVELTLDVKDHMDSNTGFLKFDDAGWIVNQAHTYWGINTSDSNNLTMKDGDYTKKIGGADSNLYTYTGTEIKPLWAQNSNLNGSTERAALWTNSDKLGITISYDGMQSSVALTYGNTSPIKDTWIFTDVVLDANDILLDTNLSVVSHSVSVTPAIPEPTTATLSLLALAGLAARRRRK